MEFEKWELELIQYWCENCGKKGDCHYCPVYIFCKELIEKIRNMVKKNE